jgi:DNA-binding NtrC family response regulator
MLLSHLAVVLHVEDQMMLAMDAEYVLLEAGVKEVAHASTVAQALEIISTSKVDAAVVDAQVFDGEAKPVADALIQRGIPFIMMSGYADGFGEAYAHLTWLAKPASEEQLVSALRAATISLI